MLTFILQEGAIVEEWLPKAVFQGKQFDLRVVVIKGVAKHFVVRLGNSPMTNLHLGNARGDAALFRETIPYNYVPHPDKVLCHLVCQIHLPG